MNGAACGAVRTLLCRGSVHADGASQAAPMLLASF